jgi:hypothetical protein
MANPHRGEVPFTIGERRLMLKLTLGSLAHLEDAFGGAGLQALGERLSTGRLAARDIAEVLAAGCHGAGHFIPSDELAEIIPASAIEAAADAAVRLLAAAFGGGSSTRPSPPQAAP